MDKELEDKMDSVAEEFNKLITPELKEKMLRKLGLRVEELTNENRELKESEQDANAKVSECREVIAAQNRDSANKLNRIKDLEESMKMAREDLERHHKLRINPDGHLEIYKQAHEAYGDHQFVMLMEKCAELAIEASKIFRGKIRFEKFCEEMADVEIMIAQMKWIFRDEDLTKHVEDWKVRKIKRLAGRVRKQ